MITVVYACDDMYARQTLISMVSLIKYNPGAKVYLVSDGLSDENRKQIIGVMERYGCAVHFLEIDDLLAPGLKLDDRDRHPRTIYAKLFLHNLDGEKRILYLDSDVIVRGDLSALFSRDMKEELVAGVLMPYSRKVKENVNAPAGQPYICDGVVLFNLDLWKRSGKTEESLQYIESYQGNPPMLSEGTLNCICAGKIGVLEPKYNLMPSMLVYSLEEIRKLFRADYYYNDQAVMQEARKNPVIIHFMNELYNRPWCNPCEHPFRDSYLAIEKEIFGSNQITDSPLPRHTRITVLLRKYLPFALFAKLYHIKNKEY